MNFKFPILIALSSLALCACGASNPSTKSEPTAAPKGSSLHPGDSSFDLYISEQFCDGKFPSVTGLTSDSFYVRPDNKTERDIRGQLFIQLHPDMTYSARYVEHRINAYLNDSKTDFSYNPDEDIIRDLAGQWGAWDGELLLPNIGHAVHNVTREGHTLLLTFDSEMTIGVATKTIEMHRSQSTWDHVKDVAPCSK